MTYSTSCLCCLWSDGEILRQDFVRLPVLCCAYACQSPFPHLCPFCSLLHQIDFSKIESRPTSSQLLQFLRFQQSTSGRGRETGRYKDGAAPNELPRFQYCFYLVKSSRFALRCVSKRVSARARLRAFQMLHRHRTVLLWPPCQWLSTLSLRHCWNVCHQVIEDPIRKWFTYRHRQLFRCMTGCVVAAPGAWENLWLRTVSASFVTNSCFAKMRDGQNVFDTRIITQTTGTGALIPKCDDCCRFLSSSVSPAQMCFYRSVSLCPLQDFLASDLDSRTQSALAHLRELTPFTCVLGSYPRDSRLVGPVCDTLEALARGAGSQVRQGHADTRTK